MPIVCSLPRLFTALEVAGYLQITERTVKWYRLSGKIGHVKVGRKARFTEQHVREFLDAHNCQVRPPKPEGTEAKQASIAPTFERRAASLALMRQLSKRR